MNRRRRRRIKLREPHIPTPSRLIRIINYYEDLRTGAALHTPEEALAETAKVFKISMQECYKAVRWYIRTTDAVKLKFYIRRWGTTA